MMLLRLVSQITSRYCHWTAQCFSLSLGGTCAGSALQVGQWSLGNAAQGMAPISCGSSSRTRPRLLWTGSRRVALNVLSAMLVYYGGAPCRPEGRDGFGFLGFATLLSFSCDAIVSFVICSPTVFSLSLRCSASYIH